MCIQRFESIGCTQNFCAFFCNIQSLLKNKQKNINQRNIPRLHQRYFAIFRVACEFLDDWSSPVSKR